MSTTFKTVEVDAQVMGRLMLRIDDDEYRAIYIPAFCSFDDMRLLEDARVTFTHRGDPFCSAHVHGVWAPFDHNRPGHAEEGMWTLEYRGDTWRFIPPDNTSFWQARIADHLPEDVTCIERALAELWVEENKPQGGSNYGHGILQDLMLSTYKHENPKDFDPWLTNRERKIVAMVVQWLGTNVGRSFLHKASERMGRPQWPFTKPDTKS